MTTTTTQAGELNTFSTTELDAIEAALNIAAQHYSAMADMLWRQEDVNKRILASQFQLQADEARALVLRIQAAR